MVCKPNLDLHDKLVTVQCDIKQFLCFSVVEDSYFSLVLENVLQCSSQKKLLLLSQSIWRFQKGRFCGAYSSNVAHRLFICICIPSLSRAHIM